MVHASVGFAKMRNRLQAIACTASIGPGSTNMVTGAALATINRIPVLLLPSDYFATRAASPLLQELEDPRSARRERQRHLQAGLPVLGPHQPPRAAARGAARRDAGPDGPGRDRRGDPRAPAGRAGRSPRLARRTFHRTSLVHPPPPARAIGPGPGRRGASLGATAAPDRGRRRHLLRGQRGPAAVRGGDRHPGRRHPGRQGRAGLGSPVRRGRRRRDRLAGGERAGPGG